MILRNKKTGEIQQIVVMPIIDGYPDEHEEVKGKTSLKDFNNEWEDYKEPVKAYWYINDLDGEPFKCDLRICGKSNFTKWSEHRKKIGNYFETEEEAKKAVEKLKAWRLLRDECQIEFNGIIRDDRAVLKAVKLKYDRHEVTYDTMRKCVDALHLLFGGEE